MQILLTVSSINSNNAKPTQLVLLSLGQRLAEQIMAEYLQQSWGSGTEYYLSQESLSYN